MDGHVGADFSPPLEPNKQRIIAQALEHTRSHKHTCARNTTVSCCSWARAPTHPWARTPKH
eukprot:1742250-Alexandrium_andersonii.AAC.1